MLVSSQERTSNNSERILEKTNEILFYKNGVYREGEDYIIQKRSRKLVKNVKLNHIREIKAIIADETGYMSRDEFDVDEYIVNLKNGIYNFKNNTFTKHSPDYLSRVQIPIYYDVTAVCPRFDKFLASSLENNEKKIYTIWEMFAYCFIKDNTLLCKAFMHTGKGSNGKSILFGIIEACLGKQNMSAKTIHDFERNRFAVAALEGKLANVCADVGSNGISKTEMLKKIIAGDLVDCEKKYFDSYTFSPFATLIFSANDIPEIEDESNAFARRFEIIERNKAFYGDERDHTVKTIRKDPQKQIVTRIGNHCCGIIGSHPLKYMSLGDVSFTDASEKGKSLELSSSFSGQELIIWTERDHYLLGDRVNVYDKFDFDDLVLNNNNSFVDVSLNDRKVILDLPVHSNGWFAGYFTLSNPYLFYTGNNLISVDYFHTPTQQEPDKFTDATYTITTGDVVTSEPFLIHDKSLLSSGKISYEIVSESNNPVNLDLAIIRLVTPDGLVFSLPNVSSVDDISKYLNDDISLISGKYTITVTQGNYVSSHTFEYVK